MEHQISQYEMLLDEHLPYYRNVSKMYDGNADWGGPSAN
jgi:hypothetical protein